MSTAWVSGLLVNQLKEELKKRQLPVSGKKAELQERLISAITAEGAHQGDGGSVASPGPVTERDDDSAEEPSAAAQAAVPPAAASDQGATAITAAKAPVSSMLQHSPEHVPSTSQPEPDGAAAASQAEPRHVPLQTEPAAPPSQAANCGTSAPTVGSAAAQPPASSHSHAAADASADLLLGVEEPLDYDEDEPFTTEAATVAAAAASPIPHTSSAGERHVDTPHPASKQGRPPNSSERGAAAGAAKTSASAIVVKAAQDSAAAAASGAGLAPVSAPASAEAAGDNATNRKRKHAPIPNFAPREAPQVTENGKGSKGGDKKASQDSKSAAADGGKVAKVADAQGSKASAPATKRAGPPEVAAPLAAKRVAGSSGAVTTNGTAPAAADLVSASTVIPGMSALLIENFVRPFTERALRELLSKYGTVVSLWLALLKTHCVVTFETDQQAADAFAALNDLQWPASSQKKLKPKHLTPAQAADMVAAASAPAALPAAAVAAARPAAAFPTLPGDKSAAPPRVGDAVASGRLAASSEAPRRAADVPAGADHAGAAVAAMHQEAVIDLAQLFKRTATKPSIFWLPLTDEQAAAARSKAAAAANNEVAGGKKGTGDIQAAALKLDGAVGASKDTAKAGEQQEEAGEGVALDSRQAKKSRGEGERAAGRR